MRTFKPCPFCGENENLELWHLKRDEMVLECRKCGISTPRFKDIEDLETFWNTRPLEGGKENG